MNTFTRGFGRLAAPLILTLVLMAAFAASASAITVKLRIEGPSGTIFNGNVNTGPRTVSTTANNGCVADGGSAVATTATPVTALADWAESQVPQVPYNTRYGGSFLCQVGADIGGDNEYWLLKINEKAAPPPNGYVTGADELHEGDSALFYWTDDFAKKTLSLSLPAAATVGVPVSGSVKKWDGSNDSTTTPSGVAISGGSANATTDSDGKFSITFPSTGTFIVNATQSGTIRGSAVVTVGTEPVPVQIVKINRFVKCADTYKKSSKKYRRCIRIVRAKQAAAKKKS